MTAPGGAVASFSRIDCKKTAPAGKRMDNNQTGISCNNTAFKEVLKRGVYAELYKRGLISETQLYTLVKK